MPPVRFSPRRLSSLLLALVLLALTCVLLLASAVPSSPLTIVAAADGTLSRVMHKSKQIKADNHWLSTPYSGDQLALLPPPLQRRPIYCYHEVSPGSASDDRQAERRLLMTWRRAWWAQGFHPIVLHVAEAKKSPRYESLRRLSLPPAVTKDLNRWLAWETVGAGILTHHTLLPMLPDDPTLTYLGGGEYSSLKKWEGLADALLVGTREGVGAALDYAMAHRSSELLSNSLPEDIIEIGKKPPAGLAWYSRAVVESKYRAVAAAFRQSRAAGLRALNRLINTHLHISWQNQFSDGIDALKPFPEHTTAMVRGALKLARQLASCSESPIPSSCPPNLPDCTPCVATAPMRVSTPARYRNSSHVFSIGTVPHPWTLALLHNQRSSLNISWIRRESSRDPWLTTVTRSLLGSGVSGNRRVLSLKEAAATASNSFWLTAEDEMPADLNWYFGFDVPEHGMDDGRSLSPVPALRLSHKGDLDSDEGDAKETPLLERAKQVVMQSKPTLETGLRASLEAWNMADTEAWRFVRALHARRLMEMEEARQEAESSANNEARDEGRSEAGTNAAFDKVDPYVVRGPGSCNVPAPLTFRAEPQ
ncbi:hypothetical protein CP533_2353 [Ophiocordyceps camponoti-saundersi (nom. inval.)]|nr:hypothetical protein CP533_2353 [Ophiocordyceps camponoti-saundersi (nom. inval.)]